MSEQTESIHAKAAPPPPWRPDEAHDKVASAIMEAMSEHVFDTLCDGWRVNYPTELGKVSVENLEDGPPEPDPVQVALFERGHELFERDDACWPVYWRDGHGRRFEVEVEVTVRPLPPLETHIAETERMIANHAALIARTKARLSPDNAPTDPSAPRPRSLAADDDATRAALASGNATAVGHDGPVYPS